LPSKARAAARKTLGLRRIIAERGFRGVILGIRRDEQAVRSKERVFSPRDASGSWDFRHQPAEFWDQYNAEAPPGGHVRVHPLLAWTELDVWRYIEREGLPVVPLYFARDGKRFRSLGERDITFPVPSTAGTVAEIIVELEASREPERAGRAMDHESEDAFERLRAQGYM
jgi:sulfate adenylyltransferase subunit 2